MKFKQLFMILITSACCLQLSACMTSGSDVRSSANDSASATEIATATELETERETETEVITESETETTETSTTTTTTTETEPAVSPEVSPESDCEAFCLYLEGCGDCLYDARGICADLAECAAICEAEVPAGAASCIAELVSCDEEAFEGCYDATIGDDDCAQTCVQLEACDQCFIDEETGDCMNLAACALTCRELTPPAAASCIAATTSCEEIDACFGG